MNLITSAQNKIIKQALSLQNKKEREKLGLFIIEGERFVSEIPKDWEVSHYIFSEDFYKKANLDNFQFKNYFIVSNQIFKKISETSTPQGILAICKMKNFDLNYVLNQKDPCFVLLDRVMTPGNLGTIIRTADALGFNGIFLSQGCADIYNSKVLRSTMGSIFHLPVVKNCDFNILIDKLKEKNINIVATSLDTENYIYDIDLKSPTAIIIGNEARGISNDIIEKCDFLAKIPMLGKVESINASIAGSIVFYELVRQRLKN